MTNFDQRNQKVGGQFNAEHITINHSLPPEFLEELRKTLGTNTAGNKDKIINRLMQTLDEKDVALEDRESQLGALAEKYAEIETRLAKREANDTLSKKAKERLDEGDLDGAEKLLQQSLDQNLQAFTERKKAAAADAFELANIRELQLDYHGALPFYEQAVELAPKNSDFANRLGLLFDTLGEYDKAIEFYNKALTIDLKTFGPEYPNVSIYYNNLGSAWDSKGDYDKAIEFYNKALSIDLKTLAPDHPKVARSYNNLGSAWRTKGTYDETIAFYNKALSIDLKTFGPDHPQVAIIYNNLGLAWDARAIEFYNKALPIDLKIFGPDHPKVATYYNNLGSAWHAKGDYNQAIDLYNKALTSDLKIFRPDHPQVAIDYSNLGSAWDAKGDYDQAIEFYNKALSIFQGKLGNDHPYTKSVREKVERLRNKK